VDGKTFIFVNIQHFRFQYKQQKMSICFISCFNISSVL